MPQPLEDDLFRNSTMTFGEHLEELRACLFKAIFGLGIGFLVGLLIGNHVVSFIQRPLTKALTNYYQTESQNRVNAEMEKLKNSRRQLPWSEEEVRRMVKEEGLLVEEVFISPADIRQAMQALDGENKANPQNPPETPSAAAGKEDKLIRLFLWRRGEDDPRVRIKSLNAQEAFSVYIKASLLVGALLASPWIFYQIWHFVAAGLYPHERRYVHTYLPMSLGLFLFGAALAFFVVFEPVLNFLFGFNRRLGIDPDPRINEWLSFVLILPVGFGIGFQLPLVMLFLERIGIFSIRSYLSQWRISVLVIFVVAAVLSPPDPYSMLFLALPLSFLYFGGILLCKLLPRKTSPFE